MVFEETWNSGTQNGRAKVLEELLRGAVPELLKFCENAEQEKLAHQYDQRLDSSNKATSLVLPDSASHETLESTLGSGMAIRDRGTGPEGLQEVLKSILKYSVNPSAPGFLDKLYAAPLPPGVVAELVLGVLNTNLHVYQVSPVLTLIEKNVTKRLANMFGLDGPRSGGVSVQGGSASNMTSIVVARNTLFPETKMHGNGAVKGRLLLFTSAHGHYSIEKAAQALGFGSSSVIPVPVDEDGRMIATELARLIVQGKNDGDVPFYINATAGTTVLGSFDPFEEISKVARDHRIWLHVDAAWGGGFVFSHKSENKKKLQGIGLADSIATNPHKMLGVPMTCSFLLGKDMRQFQKANTLKAGYLFHDGTDDEDLQSKDLANGEFNSVGPTDDTEQWQEPYDLADLTLQCGRRGDSLKFFFSWKFYGNLGYASLVDSAHGVAYHMSKLVQGQSNLTAVLPGGQEPSCLQVCFYYTPQRRFVYGLLDESSHLEVSTGHSALVNADPDRPRRKARLGRLNSSVTANIAKALIPKGFMVDFAPALEGQEDKGSFFRVVVNISSISKTMERLVEEILIQGETVVTNMQKQGKPQR